MRVTYREDPNPGEYNRVMPLESVDRLDSIDGYSYNDDGTAGSVARAKWVAQKDTYEWDRLIEDIERHGFDPSKGAILVDDMDEPTEVLNGHHRLAVLLLHYNAKWVPVSDNYDQYRSGRDHAKDTCYHIYD